MSPAWLNEPVPGGGRGQIVGLPPRPRAPRALPRAIVRGWDVAAV